MSAISKTQVLYHHSYRWFWIWLYKMHLACSVNPKFTCDTLSIR